MKPGTGAESNMLNSLLVVNGQRIPRFLYGTAWKEDETRRLTELALGSGFRGIDTANQRRHYHEEAVGQAVAAEISRGVVAREDLFLQTKFTFRRGQDHRLPYDASAPIPVQVEQSFESSLKHLGVDRIDSFLLHAPCSSTGLHEDDWSAWRAMESIYDSGRIGVLGVSNVTREQLDRLCQQARIRPSLVQNRCYAARGWDRLVREFCVAHQLVYQAFSLLTANREWVAHRDVRRIADSRQRTVEQIVFRFAMELGMIPLTGTSQLEHMRLDLDVFQFQLDSAEVARMERIAER